MRSETWKKRLLVKGELGPSNLPRAFRAARMQGRGTTFNLLEARVDAVDAPLDLGHLVAHCGVAEVLDHLEERVRNQPAARRVVKSAQLLHGALHGLEHALSRQYAH